MERTPSNSEIFEDIFSFGRKCVFTRNRAICNSAKIENIFSFSDFRAKMTIFRAKMGKNRPNQPNLAAIQPNLSESLAKKGGILCF